MKRIDGVLKLKLVRIFKNETKRVKSVVSKSFRKGRQIEKRDRRSLRFDRTRYGNFFYETQFQSIFMSFFFFF